MVEQIQVMHCIRSLDIGSQGGGAEIFAINLSRELKKLGVNPTLAVVLQFHTETEKQWAGRLGEEGFQVFFLSDSPRPNVTQSWKEITRLCSIQRYDIVHGHYQIGNLLACLLKIRKVIPYAIRTVHTPLEWGAGWTAWLARQILTRWFFPVVMDMQIGVSSALVQQIERYPGIRIKKRPIQMIPNALSEPYLGLARKNRLQPRPLNNGPKFIITSVGRITRLKGYQYLIRAMPAILHQLPEAELWLIGDGPELPHLKRIAKKLGVNGKIRFLGQQQNVSDWLQKTDVFVLPSQVEAMPTVILEAMACGVPVIASNLPGLQDIISDGRTGWLVPPAQPQALAAKVVVALTEPDLRDSIRRASLELIEKYSINKIAVDYYEIYQQLFSGK